MRQDFVNIAAYGKMDENELLDCPPYGNICKTDKMKVFFVLMLTTYQLYPASTQTDSNFEPQGTCKDILQGYMTGQMVSTLGSLQVENIRKEFQRILENHEQEMALLKKDLETLKTDEGNVMNVSKLYTRWGKTTCPGHADTVYSGFVGGSYYSSKGGAAEPLCMPKDPEWGLHTDGSEGTKAFLYGAEYQFHSLADSRKSLSDHDAPCAVSRKNCYGGWNKEYQGYLMAGFHNDNRASKYICLDENPDTLPGGRSNTDGYVLYAVEGRCGTLPCPPYVEGRELTCVVCSQ
ncbi:hypothetical protein FSP39_007960 [Pinctada imbricata]|uniref:Uncharacterized protein n=1 Tax=Pinctada imbricata TaxID=66713 RepID=A0AA88YML9_PINIB|nr:hypothetical protein FSP39_007960 [Pinctada imbricata]